MSWSHDFTVSSVFLLSMLALIWLYGFQTKLFHYNCITFFFLFFCFQFLLFYHDCNIVTIFYRMKRLSKRSTYFSEQIENIFVFILAGTIYDVEATEKMLFLTEKLCHRAEHVIGVNKTCLLKKTKLLKMIMWNRLNIGSGQRDYVLLFLSSIDSRKQLRF